MSSVLLVEFAATDRFHRKGSFPYVHGWLKQQNVVVRWLRFGVAAARRFERGEEGVGLTPGELQTLRGTLDEARTTHVVFGSQPAASLVGGLAHAGASGLRLALLGEVAALPPTAGVEVVDEAPAALAAFLGLEPPNVAGPFFRLALPDFGFEAANAAARGAPALPFLMLGRECTFSKPFLSNSFLADLDLDDCLRRGGCAFCARPSEGPGSWDLAPEEVRAHLAALRSTLPAQADRLAVRLLGEPALVRLDELVEGILSEGFREADWLLDARADALAAMADRLAAAAGRFEGTGNRLHVALVGIESFSAAELLRLNKGVDPLTNLAAVATLLDLERRCPTTFAFREHGGLSLILFTPWTTRTDLAGNLRLLHVTGLEPLCGKVYTSRLRLVPGLPLTERARRDGLLVEAYDDPLLDTAARNLYDPEVPWRFADPALEPACRLLLRFTGAAPGEDPLARSVARALERARDVGLTSLEVALRVVELAEAGEPAQDLLARAVDWLEATAAERDGTRRGERWSGADPEETTVRLAVVLSERGVKPVSKLEPLSEAQASDLVRGGSLPNARQRSRRVGVGEAAVHEVFFGADAGGVASALAATDRLEHPESDEAERLAVAEAGRLLGYPACCSDAFAAARSGGRWSYAWLHLRRRVESPGPVPWEVNPWAASVLTPHVPCSLRCVASLEVARATAAVLRDVNGADEVARLEDQARRPWLALLEGQGSALELIPESPPGERFRYRPGIRTDAGSALLARAAEGDELVLEPLRLFVLKAGRVHADLSLGAFVWWVERCLQSDEWARLLAIREATAAHPGPGGDAGGEPDVTRASPRLLKLRRVLLHALGQSGAGGLAGFEAKALRVLSERRLRLVLARGAEVVVLDLEDSRDCERCWQRVGPFALTLPRDAEAPGEAGWRAVEALVQRLEIVLRAAVAHRAAR